MYYNAVIRVQEEIELNNLNQMGQVKDTVDMRVKELQRIAALMSFDPKLTPYMVRSGTYMAINAVKELERYKVNSSIIDELYLYFRGDELIYSPAGSSSLDTLTSMNYQFQSQAAKQFLKDTQSVTTSTMRSAESVNMNNNERSRVLTYFSPIPAGDPSPYGTFIFFIRESMLQDMISKLIGDHRMNIYIMDEKQNVLASNETDLQLKPDDLRQMVKNSVKNEINETRIKNDRYSVTIVHSDTSDWTYVAAMPSAQFFDRVFKARIFVFVILSVLILMGLGAAFLMSVRQYRPIHDLAEQLKTQWKPTGEQNKLGAQPDSNEFNWIRDIFSSVYSKQNDLALQVESQRPYIREQILFRLLKGDIDKDGDTASSLSYAGMEEFQSTHHFFVILTAPSTEANTLLAQHREHIMELISSIVFDDGIGFGVELLKDDMFAVIAGFKMVPQNIRQAQLQLAEDLSRKLDKTIEIPMTVSLGQVYSDIMHVNRSFVEAFAAMEYRMVSQKKIYMFDEITALQEQVSWYPIKEQVKFVHGIKMGDKVVALESLQSMMGSIAAREQSILLLKLMCSDVINTLFRTVTEMKMIHFVEEVKHLLDFSTLEDLEIRITALVVRICDGVALDQENEQDSIRMKVLEYISSNFKLYDFSLEQVANEFSLSIFHLSRTIKEWTGETFSDQVATLRINEAKRLLIDTDKPIQEITSEIGYVNVASFTRKFKDHEGLTPGQYRKLHIPKQQ